MLIDSHAHLMFEEFEADFDQTIERAKKVGVNKIINVGCGIEYAKQAIAMADKYPELYASVGLHPYDAEDLNEDLMHEWEAAILRNKKIVAIGETGLDYFRSNASEEIQKISFRRHLYLAANTNLPVIVHSRAADADSLSLLKDFAYPESKVEAVFHCFSSTLEFANEVWDEGYYTSFSGIITFPNAEKLREVVKEAPLDLILIETDSPYLAPQSYRGKRNEPSYVVSVAELIAEVKGISLTTLSKQLKENTFRLFPRLAL